MNKTNPDLAKMHTKFQKIADYRSYIKRHSKQVLNNIPECFIEPISLCAHYSLILNHTIRTFLKLYKKYDLKLQKYRYKFHAESFCSENAYQKGNSGM